MSLDDLPAVNACLNGAATAALLLGRRAIARKDERAHRAFMVGALALSALFLASYLAYHFGKEGVVTKFPGTGAAKAAYLLVLFTHIPLAAALLPLVGVSLRHALRGDREGHRRWVRWTFPIWLYVSVTGVVVYVMLYRMDWS